MLLVSRLEVSRVAASVESTVPTSRVLSLVVALVVSLSAVFVRPISAEISPRIVGWTTPVVLTVLPLVAAPVRARTRRVAVTPFLVPAVRGITLVPLVGTLPGIRGSQAVAPVSVGAPTSLTTSVLVSAPVIVVVGPFLILVVVVSSSALEIIVVFGAPILLVLVVEAGSVVVWFSVFLTWVFLLVHRSIRVRSSRILTAFVLLRTRRIVVVSSLVLDLLIPSRAIVSLVGDGTTLIRLRSGWSYLLAKLGGGFPRTLLDLFISEIFRRLGFSSGEPVGGLIASV